MIYFYYSCSVLYVGYRPPAVALQDTLFSVSNLHLKVINQGQSAYLQFTKGPLLQISVWSTVLGSPQMHVAALFGIVKLYRKQWTLSPRSPQSTPCTSLG